MYKQDLALNNLTHKGRYAIKHDQTKLDISTEFAVHLILNNFSVSHVGQHLNN